VVRVEARSGFLCQRRSFTVAPGAPPGSEMPITPRAISARRSCVTTGYFTIRSFLTALTPFTFLASSPALSLPPESDEAAQLHGVLVACHADLKRLEKIHRRRKRP